MQRLLTCQRYQQTTVVPRSSTLLLLRRTRQYRRLEDDVAPSKIYFSHQSERLLSISSSSSRRYQSQRSQQLPNIVTRHYYDHRYFTTLQQNSSHQFSTRRRLRNDIITHTTTTTTPPPPIHLLPRRHDNHHPSSHSFSSSSPLHNHTQKRSKVFVSQHNHLHISSETITTYCQKHNISEFRTTHTHVILRDCPFCTKPTNDKASNLFKIYIQIGGGAYFCHRCGSKGSWYDFKSQLGGFEISGTTATTGGGRGSESHHRIPSQQQQRRQRRSSSFKKLEDAMIGNVNKCLPMPNERLAAVYISNLMDNNKNNDSSSSSSNAALDYLTQIRGLETSTLRKYGVGRAFYRFPTDDTNVSSSSDGQQKSGGTYFKEAECVTFPWIMRASDVRDQEALRGVTYDWNRDYEGDDDETTKKTTTTTKTKKTRKNKTSSTTKDDTTNGNDDDGDDRSIQEKIRRDCGPWITRRIKARALENKGWQRLDPPGGGWGLFGWHTIPHDATEVVITEGEYDAMAVYQATGMPSISLPNGCRSLPMDVLPLLEKFERIYLWMDSDGPGQEGAETFAHKIGLNRTFLIHQPPSTGKDANEALLHSHQSLLSILQNHSRPLPHDGVLRFSDLRRQIHHELLNPDDYAGVPIHTLPSLTRIIKGFRRGEMTVLSGPTGAGKTTLLCQLSLDFAARSGVNTLWGSFEIKNTRLIQKLLHQFSSRPLPDRSHPQFELALESLFDRFEALPMYFLKFHGSSDIDDVLDAMDYAAYVYDVEHIILDNMQFMLSRQHNSRGIMDKFDMQDLAVEKFRRFATERNVHVTLVVHPRKEDEGVKLGMSSIYGSAKATQEADTVILLQKDGRRKYLDVKKNRFDGTLGICHLYYQHKSGRYSELPDERDGGGGGNTGGGGGVGYDGVTTFNKEGGAKKEEEDDKNSVMESHGMVPRRPNDT